MQNSLVIIDSQPLLLSFLLIEFKLPQRDARVVLFYCYPWRQYHLCFYAPQISSQCEIKLNGKLAIKR